MVGFRVFDVGLLIAWMVWFFRLRDDGDDLPPEDEDGGGGGGGQDRPRGPRDGGGGGLRLPLPFGPFSQGWRRRDGHRPDHRQPRPGRTLPRPAPARVRFPGDDPQRALPRR